MKTFKFFQKSKYNVYEEMVLGLIESCYNNNINPTGYEYPFAIMTLQGLKHKRIVIRNITRHALSPYSNRIQIQYGLTIIHDDTNAAVISHSFSIDEKEYKRLIQYEGI